MPVFVNDIPSEQNAISSESLKGPWGGEKLD